MRVLDDKHDRLPVGEILQQAEEFLEQPGTGGPGIVVGIYAPQGGGAKHG